MTSLMRSTTLLVAMTASISACASATPSGTPNGRGPAPYAALTSPTAALKVAFDEVCVPSMMDGQSLEQLALQHYLVAVSPRSTGSPDATTAWRLASYSRVYVVALPGGNCSVSVEGGNPQDLNATAVEMLKARAVFASAAPESIADGHAERIVWCTPESVRPYAVALLRRTSGRRPAFVANVLRAQGARPSFCPAS